MNIANQLRGKPLMIWGGGSGREFTTSFFSFQLADQFLFLGNLTVIFSFPRWGARPQFFSDFRTKLFFLSQPADY